LFFVLAITVCLVFGDSGKTGDCKWVVSGSKLTIQLDENKTKCKMDEYSAGGAPYYKHRSSISSIVIGKGVEKINKYAFYGFSRATSVSVGSDVEKICNHAFDGCSSLTSFSFPSRLEELGDYSFYKCTSLGSVSIHASRLDKIETSAFEGCTALKSASLSGFREIESSAFAGCTSLTQVSLPSNIRTLGSSVFRGCSSLTSLDLGSVSSVPTSLCEGCSSLASVTFSSSTTYISSNAFKGCSRLSSISLPASVTNIQGAAFDSCSSLRSIVYRGMSNPSTSAPFSNCGSIQHVCVFRSYSGSNFCGLRVYPNSTDPALDPLLAEENHCFEPMICNETYGFLTQRTNATAWINTVSQCDQYYCDNETGGSTWNKCNSTKGNNNVCLKEQCKSAGSVKYDGYPVVIPFENVTYRQLDKNQFILDVQDITGENQIYLGTEIDNIGMLLNVYLVVGTQSAAESMKPKLEEAIADPNCTARYGLICYGGNITVLEHLDYAAADRSYASLFVLFSVMVVSIISLLK